MKKYFKIILSIALVTVLLFFFSCYFYGKRTLILHTSNGDIRYRVERAITPEQQQTGLMYRKHLASKTGMIFLFKPLRVARMWMKNTLIPLDMVFFDHMGRVVSVHYHANPQDLTIISSGRPVAGVLEINAGEAQKFGIGRGTTLDLDSVK